MKDYVADARSLVENEPLSPAMAATLRWLEAEPWHYRRYPFEMVCDVCGRVPCACPPPLPRRPWWRSLLRRNS